MNRILITGGAGFVGSHAAEFYARKGIKVVVYDNLSRTRMLGKGARTAMHNWNQLKKKPNITLIRGDIRDAAQLRKAYEDVDAVIHAAAQVAVTTSLTDPKTDYEVNATGTFNVLEAARKTNTNPAVVYASTNKVYGGNVNKIPLRETAKRYTFRGKYTKGIPETFPVDQSEHTPYGASKLAGDLYVQEYAHTYGLKTGVFRMSCIYGPRQFGVEDQGWVAWFTIATITDQPLTIYGDGKQVRDVLHVSDLVKAYHSFLKQRGLRADVFNIGGGPRNTLSLLELLSMLKKYTGKKTRVRYSDWRPTDQKVYVSDIAKAEEALRWQPAINAERGVQELVNWVQRNKALF